jgi:hypothetical protein
VRRGEYIYSRGTTRFFSRGRGELLPELFIPLHFLSRVKLCVPLVKLVRGVHVRHSCWVIIFAANPTVSQTLSLGHNLWLGGLQNT